MNIELKTSQLSYSRHNQVIFQDLELVLTPGQGLWVSGPNGSGKTSLLRVLAGLLSATTGKLWWKGQALSENRLAYHQDLHFLGHLPGIKNKLSLAENLKFSQDLAGSTAPPEPIETALDQLSLLKYKDKLAEQLSAGQKRRLALARLWVSPKPLWILDEPFTNLDTEAQQWICQSIEQHLQNQGLVILASHQNFPIQDQTRFRCLALPLQEEIHD